MPNFKQGDAKPLASAAVETATVRGLRVLLSATGHESMLV
jgi:hypothetical protein